MKLSAPKSLFGQLVLSQVLLITAVAILLPVLLAHLLASTADRFISDRLMRDALHVAETASSLPKSAPPRVDPNLIQLRNRGRHVTVFNSDGTVAIANSAASPLSFALIPHGAKPLFSKRGRFDVLSYPLVSGTREPRWVVVAQDRSAPEEIVDDVVGSFLYRFIWIVPVTLMVSLLAGLLLVRSVTGNFRRAAAQADAINLEKIGVRIEPANLPLEAMPLVNATNRALDRLEAGYRSQAEFVGNVAHELRTPLALISLRTEELDPSPERDMILRGVERANHVVRQMIELASIDRHDPAMTSFDPLALVVEVSALMAPLVFQADHILAFEEPPTPPPPVLGVPGLVQIALTNLIDNAIRHTPGGCTVTLSVDSDGAISVEDDGPGMAIETKQDRSRRYRSATTNRSDSAGIGLAVVERTIRASAGTVELSEGAAGGCKWLIQLKASEQPIIAGERQASVRFT